MVLLSIFLLAGLDQALNPRSKQTIGKRVRIGLTDYEYDKLTKPIDKKSGLSVKKRKRYDYTF